MLNKRVLIVEDETDIADLLALHMGDITGEVMVARDGHEGQRLAFARDWDLIILDVRLPGPDGLSICRALRRDHRYVPILLLTAKSSELDRVLGLEIGADDYLTKPFSIAELVARAKALFRRADGFAKTGSNSGQTISAGSLVLDPDTRTTRVDGRAIDLTAKEFDLLLYFARHPGRVFKRCQLLDEVWGIGHDGYEHTVNSHINRLRSKIEANPARPNRIVTVWGVGYKFQADAPGPSQIA